MTRWSICRIVAVVAAAVLVSAPATLPVTQTFDGHPIGSWPEGSTHGDWHVAYDGYGRVWVGADGDGDGTRVLNLRPTTNPPTTGTSAALVTSVSETRGDLALSVRMRTLSQNAHQRVPAQDAEPWEVAWLFWNHRVEPGTGDEGTGKRITKVEKGYYLALKPNGWELGKLDQELFLGHGGQRYLATGSSPTFPVGPTWHDVEITQTQVDDSHVRIAVTVDGERLTQFTDGPGSGGYPPWSEHQEQEVYTSGRVGLYTEDARVQFDDVTRARP